MFIIQYKPANFIKLVTLRSFSNDYTFPVLLDFFNTVGNPITPSSIAFYLLSPLVISIVSIFILFSLFLIAVFAFLQNSSQVGLKSLQ